MAYRALSPEFFAEFKTGKYRGLVKCLQKYPQFMLNLRGKYATIYYRGLRVLEIKDDGLMSVTPEYVKLDSIKECFGHCIKSIDDNKTFELSIPNQETTVAWDIFLHTVMRGIDQWCFDNIEKTEKEIQQRIVLENNILGKARSTDYFIVDTEYADGDARFDAIALHWSRDTRLRHAYQCGIAFIEVKAGESAINGACGVSKHLSDIVKYEITEDFYKDLERMVDQLSSLGLIDRSGEKELKIDRSVPPQMIFAIANYNQKSGELKKALESITVPEKIDLRFATSSFMGYGLYDECMLDLDTFIKRFNL